MPTITVWPTEASSPQATVTVYVSPDPQVEEKGMPMDIIVLLSVFGGIIGLFLLLYLYTRMRKAMRTAQRLEMEEARRRAETASTRRASQPSAPEGVSSSAEEQCAQTATTPDPPTLPTRVQTPLPAYTPRSPAPLYTARASTDTPLSGGSVTSSAPSLFPLRVSGTIAAQSRVMDQVLDALEDVIGRLEALEARSEATSHPS